MTPVRLLIVDDHTLFREGLQAILMHVADIEVVGEAADGIEAVQQAEAFQPEIILMDIQMDNLNGVEACRRILQTQPDITVIMLTMLEDSDSLFAAMRAGAKGYILKGADKAEVLRTIRAAAEGSILFGPAIANRMTNFFRTLGQHPTLQTAQALPFPELTDREREVLDLIAQGLNNHAIARLLDITAKTVSNHISNLFNKLQVADRAQAIVKAREEGLGKEKPT